MKKILTLFILLSFSFLYIQPGFSQEKNMETELQTSPPQKERITYTPGGRRDPFKDLLGGKEVTEKTVAAGKPELSIDDINLVGIAEFRGEFRAIVNGPQGFPYFIKKGDKLSDGFVLSVDETQVIFRQTSNKGLPFIKPKDIVKILYTEER